ncbi:MAG: Stp1/IreP family PP2C-type Ser/Thr phosphatase [Eubacterium sp.]|nr:Stp1/IreP family PP2C-type Ser/Thr phosphatase [Eubacterium sp.]MCI8919065.1 Stp1/IreP family PP2C-type Ser/Thr phosphatase [Eubacterium sp.]
MKTFSITDVGRRREMNQDYIYTSETSVGNLPNLFIVADGMGGHNAGDFASRYTVEHVVEAVKSSGLTEPVSLLGEALRQTNSSLMELAEKDPHLRGTGTTFVAATIAQGRMSVANIGDSRLYIVNQSIVQVTRDHSLVQEMVRMGEMDQDQARVHPDKNIITRAVGAVRNIEIDFFEVNLKQKDRILLCSDGLTNMLEDQEIRSIMCSQRDIVESVQRLVAAANMKGGKDNISVIIVDPFSDEVKRC